MAGAAAPRRTLGLVNSTSANDPDIWIGRASRERLWRSTRRADFVQSNLTPATSRPLLTPIRKGVMFPGVSGCLGMSGVGASVPFTAWYPTLKPALKLLCGTFPSVGIAQSGMTNPPPATCPTRYKIRSPFESDGRGFFSLGMRREEAGEVGSASLTVGCATLSAHSRTLTPPSIGFAGLQAGNASISILGSLRGSDLVLRRPRMVGPDPTGV